MSHKTKQYTISGKKVEFDPGKEYLDFFIEGNNQTLISIDLESMLDQMQTGKLKVDENLEEYMVYLGRWTQDAPRKKFYRQMRKEGAVIMSAEQFFDGEDGEEIISKLENTGKFAEYFLKQVFGSEKKFYKD